jgi:hypothetical protein
MRSRGGDETSFDVDAALVRLEDLLLALPYDRALPDLADLLERAGIPEASLRRDDRLLKVLHEAVLARPLAQLPDVVRVRTEVELLTLEVELLTDRLVDGAATATDVASATNRLREVRLRLDDIQDDL